MSNLKNSSLSISAEARFLADLIISVLENKEKRFLGLFKKRIKSQTRQTAAAAAEAYITKFRERHGKLKVLGMSKPVSLDSVYVPIRFTEAGKISDSMSLEDMERACRARKGHRALATTTSSKTAIDVVNNVQYLSIIGAPGSGKTTLLRKIALEALKYDQEAGFRHVCIPLWFDLKKIAEDNRNFQQYIEKELDNFDFPESAEFTKHGLKEGRFLILFDGLDEVPSSEKDKIVDKIENFIERYDRNRYVLSCRAANYLYASPRFSEITLADNNQDQIKTFIYNWFSADEGWTTEFADDCWKLLRKPDNISVRELAKTPLLLTFLCLVYSRSLSFSGNRSMLYHEGLRILLQKWSDEKRVAKSGVYEGLHVELEEKLLAEIAYRAFKKDRLLFTKISLVKRIREFLLKELNAPDNLSGEAVLEAISIQQGILVEQSEGIYSFSHLTFQEFLAARYIHENYSNHELAEMVRLHAGDRRWQEVFLLIAGLKYDESNSVNLLLHLNQVAQKYIGTQNLVSLWTWANEVTAGLPNTERLFERRANVLYRAFHYGRILAKSPLLETQLETIQVYLQSFIYSLGASGDLTLTTHLINALDSTVVQIKEKGKLSDPLFIKNIEYDLKKAIKLAQPLVKEIRTRAGRRSLQYLKTHGQDISIDTQLRRNEIFAGPDFLSLFEDLHRLSIHIPSAEHPRHTHIKFFKDLKQICLSILKLDESWLALSNSEIRACQDSLYVTHLMLKCRKEAKRISSQLWETIENQILALSAGGFQPALVSARIFLEQAGTAFEQTNERTLTITEIPESLGISAPVCVAIFSEEITPAAVKTLFDPSEAATQSVTAGLVIYQTAPDKRVRELFADLRIHHGFPIIPISVAEIENALISEAACRLLLATYVQRYGSNFNFFKISRTGSDSLLFTGRSKLLPHLQNSLKRNTNVGLFGLPKSGKTAAMLQLKLDCLENPTVYLDLSKYDSYNYAAELLDTIIQRLYALVQAKNPLAEQPPSLVQDSQMERDELLHRFNRDFRNLVRDLQAGGYQMPVFCLLDQIGTIFPQSNAPARIEEFNAVFGCFRTLSKKEQLLSLLITDIQPRCNRVDSWGISGATNNPLHQLLQETFIQPFSSEETGLMLDNIGGLMKWNFDQPTKYAIHRVSGGYPFLARKIADCLYVKAKEQDPLRMGRNIDYGYAQTYLSKILYYDQTLRNYVKQGIVSELKSYSPRLKMHHVVNILSALMTATNDSEGWVPGRTLLALLQTKLKLSEIQCLDALTILRNLGITEQIDRLEDGYYRIRILVLHQWFQMVRKSKPT